MTNGTGTTVGGQATGTNPAPKPDKSSYNDWTWPEFTCGALILAIIIVFGVLAMIVLSATQIQSRFAGLSVNGRRLSVVEIGERAKHWRTFGKTAAESAMVEADRAREELAKATKGLQEATAERSKLGASKEGDEAHRQQIVAAEANETAARASHARAKSYFDAKATEARMPIPVYWLPQTWNVPPLLPAALSDIENAITEHSDIDEKGWYSISGWAYYWARSPTEMLTLWLVVILGALGASVQLGYEFVTKWEVKWSHLVFRPFFGAATALVVFVFFKAGVLVMAVTPDQTGQATVNPYTVGFVAIISGLLAEQALVTLRSLGSRMFAAGLERQPSRWAREDVVKAGKLDKMKVAGLIGIAVDEAERKLAGTIRSTWDEQRTIAAMLQLQPRDVFSEIPPVGATDANRPA